MDREFKQAIDRLVVAVSMLWRRAHMVILLTAERVIMSHTAVSLVSGQLCGQCAQYVNLEALAVDRRIGAHLYACPRA